MSMHRTIFAAMTFTLAACATATAPSETETAEPDPRQGAEIDRICFTSGIRGFSHATKRSVVLSKGSKDYLVTTANTCFDLDDAETLATDTINGCLSNGDKLVAFYTLGGNKHFNSPCFVDKIYEWNKDAPSESDADPQESESDAAEAVPA